MVRKEAAKRFSCVKCGATFEVYPPDDVHYLASLKKDDVEAPIEMTCRCRACGNETTIYWGYQKVYVGVA